MNKAVFIVLTLSFFGSSAFCHEGIYEAEAVQSQAVMCQLEEEPVSSGQIQFMFNPFDENDKQIRYDGLALTSDERYAVIMYKIRLTTILDFKDESFSFEGVDASMKKGFVRGYYRNDTDFEVTAYTDAECVQYQLTPPPDVYAQDAWDESFFSYEAS